MNRGCPHRCLFCNEQLTAGDRPERITEAAFTETVRTHLAGAGRKSGPVQIAFYGGTFTGMVREEQRRLLKLAAPFLREGAADGIRISTRPDGIDAEGLDFLRSSGVTTVEVGAQSLHDEVLLRSRRGHTADDTVRALALLRQKGFETGIHLMAGLPGDSPGRFVETIERVIALRPDMVRIHPTLVLRDTPLAQAFREGNYLPLGLADAVALCKNALKALTAAGIPVIRLGLQTTRELEEPGAVVAGPFHPAFRSLVETALFLEMAAAFSPRRYRRRRVDPPLHPLPGRRLQLLRREAGKHQGLARTLRSQRYSRLARPRPSPADTHPDARSEATEDGLFRADHLRSDCRKTPDMVWITPRVE
ncbi:MAG: radical SAM protein [Deltaproteobacteria bacterium]|nr:radical SAM protein [Deltaproteobacteria bacterium]